MIKVSTHPVILIGGGGHAAVVADALLSQGRKILGVVDPRLNAGDSWRMGLKVLGCDSYIDQYDIDEIELANGLGFLPGQSNRQQVFHLWTEKGYQFATVCHTTAIIGREVVIGEGVQLLAASVVSCGASIGKNVIVNTGAVIEHDCIIGESNHVAPSSTLCGGVETGVNVFIGVGAKVIQNIYIGNNVVVGAGSIVTKNAVENTIVYPAQVSYKGKIDD